MRKKLLLKWLAVNIEAKWFVIMRIRRLHHFAGSLKEKARQQEEMYIAISA